MDTDSQGTPARNIAIGNLTWVDFFFFLRPGEYCNGGTDTAQHPFRLKYVQFFIGKQPHNAVMASNAVLAQADFVSLLLTTQKNRDKGGSIGHSHTGHPQGCPVAAMSLRVAYL